MRTRSPFSPLRLFSAFFLLSALVLLTLQLVRFSRLWQNFPPGLSIAGIPVGQLGREQAGNRLLQIYSLPIEIQIGQAVFQMDPNDVDFQLDLDAMLAAADQERTRQSYWIAFWNNLWGRRITPIDIPLRSTYSEKRLRQYLQDEVASRYDQPAIPARPATGTVEFLPGQPGAEIDIERAVDLIDVALKSPIDRKVNIPTRQVVPPAPAFQNLEVLLKQTIELSGFEGVVGVYMMDLQTGQEIHFAYNQGQDIPVEPEDVAFTASSTIKIPITISVFRKLNEPPKGTTLQKLELMLTESNNEATDWLMQNILSVDRGPLIVSDDMTALGLKSTFLAGYFAPGSPILKVYSTPSNQRQDVSTEPDRYNQTTPSEMGMLLSDIYMCAHNNGGSLLALFPGEITPQECQLIEDLLVGDKIATMIPQGLPEGTRVAHKHGWVQDAARIMHDMSDAAIVFTPGGDFVLTIYLFQSDQLVFDAGNQIVADLARAVYHFYNLTTP